MRQNPHVRICGGLGSATALVYPTAQGPHDAPELHNSAGVSPRADHLVEARGAQARILRERVADQREVGVEGRRTTGAAADRGRVVGDGRPHRLMVDAEGGGDGPDPPVFAEVQTTNLGVLCGADHLGAPSRRDGPATAPRSPSDSRARTRRSGAQAPVSRMRRIRRTRRGTVCRSAGARGQADPSRARDTRVDDRDDRGALRDSAGGGGARLGTIAAGRGCEGGAQYARPRSHEGQIAKRRLQRRQVFWRSGASTMSEPRNAPTGPRAQSVPQERRLARPVGASRLVTEGPEILRFGPSPRSTGRAQPTSFVPFDGGCGLCRTCGRTGRAHQVLAKPHRPRFRHSAHSPVLLFVSGRKQNVRSTTVHNFCTVR